MKNEESVSEKGITPAESVLNEKLTSSKLRDFPVETAYPPSSILHPPSPILHPQNYPPSPQEDGKNSSFFILHSSLKKIGIYGGSFNPIHNGHIALARNFLEKTGLDEVWFVVSPQNPFKVNDKLLDDGQRLLMVREALQDEPGMVASDYEFHLPRPSYMWNTLQSMSRDYPGYEFTLLIGGDNWTRFSQWYHSDDILRTYRIAIYPRRGDTIDSTTLPANVFLLDTGLIDVSSTEIRRRISQGLSIDSLVPPSVAETIRSKQFYI